MSVYISRRLFNTFGVIPDDIIINFIYKIIVKVKSYQTSSPIALLLFCFTSQLMKKMSKMGENRKKILKRIIISRKNVKKNHKKWRKTIEIGFVL